MNKAQYILSLFYFGNQNNSFNEDFTSSSDWDRAKNNKRARASKMGWKKYRRKYDVGMARNVRLNYLFGDKKSFLTQLRTRIKKVKNAIRQQKMKELAKQKQQEKYKFNLLDCDFPE